MYIIDTCVLPNGPCNQSVVTRIRYRSKSESKRRRLLTKASKSSIQGEDFRRNHDTNATTGRHHQYHNNNSFTLRRVATSSTTTNRYPGTTCPNVYMHRLLLLQPGSYTQPTNHPTYPPMPLPLVYSPTCGALFLQLAVALRLTRVSSFLPADDSMHACMMMMLL